jgi:hypothetical protein
MNGGTVNRDDGSAFDAEGTASDPVRCVLTDQSRRRLRNQVGRAYRGTYGARTGLRTLARQFAVRLIEAGWVPESVSAALARVVLEHSAANQGARNLLTGVTLSTTLVELTQRSVADAVVELSQRPQAASRQ